LPGNDFERLCSLYLRLNGFFHTVNFTLHYTPKRKKTEEIDFVGVRFPDSCETPMTENGNYDEEFRFEDDKQLLDMIDDSKITILLGEATVSPDPNMISDRVKKLENYLRTKYALQRFGLFDNKEIERIVKGRSDGFSLLRVVFVVSKKTFRESDFKTVRFLSYHDIYSFIQNRASHALKASGIHLLPEGLQDFVTFLQALKFEQ
jgi:hypothetical protein